MEYATLSNPDIMEPSAWRVKMNDNTLEYSFMRPSAAADLTLYILEWTGSLLVPWNSTNIVGHSPRGFVRLRVERR